MSKHKSWRTKMYWKRTGGLLIEEFLAIRMNKSNSTGRRLIDGVIILGEPDAIQSGGTYDVTDKNIVVVQTKANRLGMTLMGQALFSKEIMRRYKPSSIKTVAICGKYDSEMNILCQQYDIEVVVIEDTAQEACKSEI